MCKEQRVKSESIERDGEMVMSPARSLDKQNEMGSDCRKRLGPGWGMTEPESSDSVLSLRKKVRNLRGRNR